MQKIQQTVKVIFLALVCSAPLAPIAKADHRPSHHEQIFANSATKHELIEAYLGKCAEAHHFADELEKEKNSIHWKAGFKGAGYCLVALGTAYAIRWIAKQ